MICKICSNKVSIKNRERFLYGKRLKSKFIQFCENCKIGQVDHIPDADEIYNFYNSIGTQKLFKTQSNKSSMRFKKLDTILEFILKKTNFNLNSKISYLDIGAGSGRFCKQLLDLSNFSVDAIEPDKTKCNLLKYFNINFQNKTFESFCLSNNKKYNLIKLSQVLEHVVDPKDFLIKIYSSMNENSYLWIDIPNCNSKYFKNRDNDLVGHLFFFNKNSLKNLCNLSNFKIVSIGSFGDIIKPKKYFKILINRIKSIIHLYVPISILNVRKKYMEKKLVYKKRNFLEKDYFQNSYFQFHENIFENEKLFVLLKK